MSTGTQSKSQKCVEQLVKDGVLLIGPHYYYKSKNNDERKRDVELLDTHKWCAADSHGNMRPPSTSISALASELKQELDTNYSNKKSKSENGWRRIYFKDGENKDKSLESVTKGHRDIVKKTRKKKENKKRVVKERRRERNYDIILTDTDETKEEDDDDSFKLRKQRMMENHEIRMLQRQHAEEIKQQERKEYLQKQKYEIEKMRNDYEIKELNKKMSELQIN